MTEEARLNPLKEEADAIARIALTNDGRLQHRYLRRVLESVIDFQIDGALSSHNGRRSLARDLMALMAAGIENRAGTDSADAPILSRPARGASVIANTAGRRRATVTPGDGWGPEPDEPTPAT